MIYKVTLNGKIYEVEVEKGEAVLQAEYEAALPVAPVAAQAPVAAPQQAAAPQAAAASGGASAAAVTAPMPGNINDVKIASGQAVKKGDLLIILEAMKMENEIVSPKDGTIGKVYVSKGASVDTGAPLVEVL